MKLVIDTSAILAVLLDEPERPAVIAATTGAQLCAPASVPWEVCNALSAALKRRRLALPQAFEILKNFGKIPVQLMPVDLTAALELAAAFGIYAYDAFVLEAARAQQCALLSLDRGVQRIARASRIQLLEV
ncbi:MAG: type II toxin-antitoxin system VapC family toxin [Acidobacteria bacterium]|nr:type II toxin-antitoxin system VapC family toxin [Acidobacteriota bacterium]